MMLLWMSRVLERFLCGDGVGIVSFGAGINNFSVAIVYMAISVFKYLCTLELWCSSVAIAICAAIANFGVVTV